MKDNFILKYEKYINILKVSLITPENWDYFKKHKEVPQPEFSSHLEELKFNLTKNGWDHDAYVKDFSNGVLSESDFFELLDVLWTLKEVDDKVEQISPDILFGTDEGTEKLFMALTDYLDVKGFKS